MNYGIITYTLGLAGCIEGVFLLLPTLVALIYHEDVMLVYLALAVICGAVGALLLRFKPKQRKMYAREGLVTVGLVWIFLSLVGAIPYVLTGEIPSYIDALFETVSGYTTTGASILNDIEALSHASLFWRSFAHWVGGMGILVFILAIVPNRGNGSMIHMMRAESPGPSVGKLVPKVRQTALILYAIYFGLTLVEFLILLISGMQAFDALTLCFGTAGTGGFAIKNDSVVSYTSAQQTILTVFMVLFGVNFTFYFCILQRKMRQACAMTEIWVYLGILVLATVLIGINVLPMFPSVGEAFHHAAFQVSSIMTTTGFCTADFNLWPAFSRTLLVLLMFIGACAGSTGGGIKVSRIILLVKGVRSEISISEHPKSVRTVHMDGRTVEAETIRSVNAYIVLYLLIFVASVVVLSLNGKDLVTNFTAVAATLNNIGPGLAEVGATGNYANFSVLSKLVLSFDMLAGRLELMPILMLMVPSTWKR